MLTSLLLQLTSMDLLPPFIAGLLVVLVSIARAEAQLRVVLKMPGHETAAPRGRKLGGVCAFAGVVYAYVVGDDSWLHFASWINAACSVISALTTGSTVRRAAPRTKKKVTAKEFSYISVHDLRSKRSGASMAAVQAEPSTCCPITASG